MEDTRLRETLFTVLASLFLQPPEKELIESLWPILVSAASAESEEPGLPEVKTIQESFTRLLIVPGDGCAPPYATVYLNHTPHVKPTLWGPEAVRLQMEYEAAGLSIAPGGLRIPDHLGVELQFMAYLCRREAEAWQNGDALQAQEWRLRQERFVQEHLLSWLPKYSERLRQVNAHPFYQMAVKFLEELLGSEINLEVSEP